MTTVRVNLSDLTLLAADAKTAIRKHKADFTKDLRDAYDLAKQAYDQSPWYKRWFTSPPLNIFVSRGQVWEQMSSHQALLAEDAIDAFHEELEKFDWIYYGASDIMQALKWSTEDTIDVEVELLVAMEEVVGSK